MVQRENYSVSRSEKEENAIPSYMLHLEQSICIHSWKGKWEVLEQL